MTPTRRSLELEIRFLWFPFEMSKSKDVAKNTVPNIQNWENGIADENVWDTCFSRLWTARALPITR